MSQTVIGLLALFAFVAFIAFAFRQGMRVRPSGRADHGPDFTPSDFSPPH